MLLTPRYDAEPVLIVDGPSVDPHPVLAQRRRLETVLTDLSDDEWQRPSRCEGWTVQDVITHLSSTNGFWAFSIQSGLAGDPTRFLAAFDPVASPAELVDQAQGAPAAETLEGFVASNAQLTAAVEALDAAGWGSMAEAPPGHLPIARVADHALWDSWVHERDIVVPLGRTPAVDPAEVVACLRYGAGLGRAFELCRGSVEEGSMTLQLTSPAVRLVVTVAGGQVRVHEGRPEGPVLEGDAVTVLEQLSMRDAGVPVPPEVGWLTGGLAVVFDQVPA